MDNQQFGKRLKAAREAAKLTQTEVAKECGITQPYLLQIEKGIRTPSTSLIGKLARAAKTSTAWLMGDAVHDETDIYHSDPRASIRKDNQVAPGLRALAEDEPMCHVLEVSRDEWVALRSIAMKTPPGKNGYLLLLHALRAAQLSQT